MSSDTIFHRGADVREGKCPAPSADSTRVSCQLLAKEWALNTGKMPPGGLPRNSLVKKLTILT